MPNVTVTAKPIRFDFLPPPPFTSVARGHTTIIANFTYDLINPNTEVVPLSILTYVQDGIGGSASIKEVVFYDHGDHLGQEAFVVLDHPAGYGVTGGAATLDVSAYIILQVIGRHSMAGPVRQDGNTRHGVSPPNRRDAPRQDFLDRELLK